MAEAARLNNYVFNHRHKIRHLGFGENERNNSLQQLRQARAVYGKNRNEFHLAVFSAARDTDQRQTENDRMPELQNAVSNRIIL